MKRFLILLFLLLSSNVFSQTFDSIESQQHIPVSIYSFITTDELTFLVEPLPIDLHFGEYKFIYPRVVNIENSILLDLRNFDRMVSFEDLMDNYQKRELNKYFFSGYDLRTIPWRKN